MENAIKYPAKNKSGVSESVCIAIQRKFLYRSGNLATGDAKETSATDISYYQDHTKVTFSQEDLELLMPLITDDATRSQLQITLSNSFASQNLHWRICRVILVILGGGAVFLLVLVIITAVV